MSKLTGMIIPNKDVLEKVGFVFYSHDNGEYSVEIPENWKIVPIENNNEWSNIYDEYDRVRGTVQKCNNGTTERYNIRLQPRYKIVEKYSNELMKYEISFVDFDNTKIYHMVFEKKNLSLGKTTHNSLIIGEAMFLHDYMMNRVENCFPNYNDPSEYWDNKQIEKNKVKVISM